uniref:Uncharacterized protein n=1 Tax=Arundo donax TaxID=35708 RepID=A0A0A9AW89_ARUDO
MLSTGEVHKSQCIKSNGALDTVVEEVNGKRTLLPCLLHFIGMAED